MARDEQHTIHDPDGNPVTVFVRRDKRLKKSARWVRERDGSLVLRVPERISRKHLTRLLEDVAGKLARQQQRSARRTDADLQARAEHINRTYFRGEIEWQAIRWVSNMQKRLASCTNGGPTDGHIRVSDRIREWPEWVVDYIIAHELAHRIYPNHSREFWDYLAAAYPLTERARGFIQGVGFAQSEAFDEDVL
jgi:predicted metal-dependent hydrolase